MPVLYLIALLNYSNITVYLGENSEFYSNKLIRIYHKN